MAEGAATQKKQKKLTDRQFRFCEEYVVEFNATQAAIRAGFSEKTARSIGQRLLTNVDIQKKIQELKEDLSRKTDITKEEILDELKVILRANIREYVDFDGTTVKFKSFEKLSVRQLKAVESIKETSHGVELKLHGKTWTIERLCKMLGYDAAQAIDLSMEGFSGLMKKVSRRKGKKNE